MGVNKLCIDCGGTKVSYAAFTEANEIIEEKTLDLPCNINKNKENFINIVEELIAKYNPNDVLVGVAGWLSFSNKEEVLSRLNVKIVSDVNLAKMVLLQKEYHLGVILGTGSVFFSNDHVYGGFGNTLGDEGSGYHFGKMTLLKYLEDFESENETMLRSKVEAYFNCEGREVLSVVLKNEKENLSRLSKKFMDDRDFDEAFTQFKEKFLEKVEFYLGITKADRIVISGSILKSSRFLNFVTNDKRFVVVETPLSHAIILGTGE